MAADGDPGASKSPTLVVGVGASAGGLEAFRELLRVLPSNTGMAFVFVQHLDPAHASLLCELLVRYTTMPVVEATDGASIQPDTVYIITPDTALAVVDGRISLSAPTLHRGVRLPVDHLLRSLAGEYGNRSAGLILSGSGGDGSSGIRDIKAAGGLVIAQDPTTAGQPGMPQSAIDTGMVDRVSTLSEIPEALARFASLEVEDAAGPGDADYLLRLAPLLEAQSSFDLRNYKSGTVHRRLMRRMVLSGHDGLDEYYEMLRADHVERQMLIRDLLINVTDFFRDPEAYAALRETVIEPLVERASPGHDVRAWVAGCATGEEAYSIAMEILDEARAQNKRIGLRIFATDLDAEALAVARAGSYPPSIVDQVSEERLSRYFESRGDEGFRVLPMLRDVISFAAHDLTKDPPFSRMDLVSCRNVLIYLTAEAQRRVLQAVHFALLPEAHLFLSTSESTGAQRELFTTVAKTSRIYAKRGPSTPQTIPRAGRRAPSDDPPDPRRLTSAEGGRDLARRVAVDAWVPPSIVVRGDSSIVFTHGELSPYLQFPQGDQPTLDLTSVLRKEFATRVRGALFRCRRSNEPLTVEWSSSGGNGVRVTARPAQALGDDAVLLSFESIEKGEVDTSPLNRVEEAGLLQLERELAATREDLRNTVEELETTNEELRSANEESMSMNEELQSANEELEATSEELRSLNEELTTVNTQLREKIDQVERSRDDLNNFFVSAKLATLFLDDELRIKRFTPAASELLGVDDADAGRHIGGFAHEQLVHELVSDAQAVLENLSPRNRELLTKDGRWVHRRVLPYRTLARRVEGVVCTFNDITELRAATSRLEMRERQQATLAHAGIHALREPNLQSFMDHIVRDVQQTLATDLCKILELQPGGESMLLRAGVGWDEGLVGDGVVGTGADSQAGYTLHAAAPVVVGDLRAEKRFSGPPLLVDHGVVSGLSCVIRDADDVYGVFGAHTRDERPFTNEDANFLQSISVVVGAAIGRTSSRRRHAIDRGVVRALAGAGSWEEASSRLLTCLSRELPASVGEVWWLAKGRLERRRLHVASPLDSQLVEREFHRATFEVGEGLVGRACASGDALWDTDLGASDTFDRRQAAKRIGLKSAVCFPIRADGVVLGAVTAFATTRLSVDRATLQTLEMAGRTAGDFYLRAEIEERARRLATITESSHDAIISYSPDLRVREWLAGAEYLYGYDADEMTGESLERLVPVEERPALRRVHERILRGEVVEPFECTRLCGSNRRIAVSVRVVPIRGEGGEVLGFTSTERDITRLRDTQQRLEDADRQKDEFLAMLGHELRNPLAAIRSATELLTIIAGDDPKLERPRGVLHRQTTHMAKLIDGLLDVSRIIRGKVVLAQRVVDLVGVIRDVVSDSAERTGRDGLALDVELPARPLWIEGDRVRLTQVVDNLLSNSIKYTPKGGRITVKLTSVGGAALLEVSDTGVGIDASLLPHVFEVFRQSEQSIDRSSGGLGLGLALVKSLIELHGGSVSAQSGGRGRGAVFCVRLPLTTQRPEAPHVSERSEAVARILIVEDNEDAAEMLREVLELGGHRVEVANRGKQGVELAREFHPQLIICDLGLPDGMSGFEVAEAIRADENLRSIRLVALSGYGGVEDKARAFEAGFDEHRTKPIDVATLKQVVSHIGSEG